MVYTRPLPEPARSAMSVSVSGPVTTHSISPGIGSLLLTAEIWQTAGEPESDTANDTGTIVLSGGQSTLGDAVTLNTRDTKVCVEKFVTVVEPSRFTVTMKAKPSVVSVVRAGIVPAASENMLQANVLPEVATPSGELSAGPYRLRSNERVEPKVNP